MLDEGATVGTLNLEKGTISMKTLALELSSRYELNKERRRSALNSTFHDPHTLSICMRDATVFSENDIRCRGRVTDVLSWGSNYFIKEISLSDRRQQTFKLPFS